MQCPVLGRVPTSSLDDGLLIKATATGITLLAKFDPDKNKYLPTGPSYGKRYIGSQTHAVDINGKLWLSAKELDQEVKEAYRKFKGIPEKTPGKKEAKKSSKDAPPLPKEIVSITETDQISEIIPDCAKKTRRKSYVINKSKVRQRLYAYINTGRGRKQLYFWTVSFPEGTPDAMCYKIFNVWLTSLRKYGMLRDYLWVAERQDGKRITQPGKLPTNTIHFHIAIPHYMNVQRANNMMRGTLKTYAKRGDIPGAVTDRRSQRVNYLNCIANYNGVDISKHRKTNRPINFAIKKGSRALASYLTKYVTKNDSEFEHLAFHNSRGFSALFTGVTFTFKEFNNFKFGPFLNRVRVFEMNYATFIPWLYGPPPLLEDHLYKLNTHLQLISDNGREPTQ